MNQKVKKIGSLYTGLDKSDNIQDLKEVTLTFFAESMLRTPAARMMLTGFYLQTMITF